MNTLLCLTDLTQAAYSSDIFNQMVEMYAAGHQLLSFHGNQAYDVIKFIEATANSILADLSQQTRPLIPPLGNFSRFVEETYEQFQKTFHVKHIIEFKNTLYRSMNPHDLIFKFGSYRHWGHPPHQL